MSFFRYPGGKRKLLPELDKFILNRSGDLEYREPFFGGGSVGCRYIDGGDAAWLNDKDTGIASLWNAVISQPDELKALIREFIPSIDKFDEFRSMLLSPSPGLSTGFMKLAVHQMSYSGLGMMSGGPLGGRNAKNYAGSTEIPYPIDCRWSPDHMGKKIDALHSKFSLVCLRNGSCTSLDFADVISDANPAFLYIDPPYYDKGNDLYCHGFAVADHIRLCELLKKTSHEWVLSYDDVPAIHELYSWAKIHVVGEVKYSITATGTGTDKKSTKKSELIITKGC